jgi:hypothetical protein
MDQYEARFKVVVTKSTLRGEMWYARILMDLPENWTGFDPSAQLAGTGSNAVQAVQMAFQSFANQSPYQQIVIETALMKGTRTKAELTDGKKRK